MKYAQRDELVEGLLDLANFVQTHGLEIPAFKIEAGGYVSNYHPKTYEMDDERPKQVLRDIARIPGGWVKDFSGHSFYLTRKFSKSVRLKWWTSREQVCEKKVVGFKDIPEVVIEARREEIVEWECTDAILAR
jgi:hypothetical protein